MQQEKHSTVRIARSLAFGLAIMAFLLAVLALNTQAAAPNSLPTSGPAIVGVPTWGVDHVVNPTPQLTPSGMRNHDMSVNPIDPNRLIAAYENSSGNPIRQTDYAWSTDAGRTWGTGTLTETWGAPGYTPFGDLNTAYDGRGTAYLSTFAISNTSTLLAVVTSTTGMTWNTPNIVATASYTEYRSFSTLSVDERTSGPNAGNAYLFFVYTNVELEPYWRGIWMRYSRDGARTWNSADVQVSDPDHLDSIYSASAVAPNGTVYAAWEYLPGLSPFNPHELYLDRSTDGGLTWGEDRLVTGAPIQYAGGPDYKGRELILVVNSICNVLRLHHRPSLAVSRVDSNTVYVAWTDSRWDLFDEPCNIPIKHSDIAFSRTTDAGLTWSPPMRINNDPQGNGVDQFLPTLAVASDGTLGITWYDRIYDPNHVLYDLSYAQSTDGGLTWSAPQRVTDVSGDPNRVQDVKLVDEIGFRKSLVFGPDFVVASWLDTRLGEQQGDFFVDRGAFPAITPTLPPTGTPTASPTATSCPIQFSDVEVGSPFYTFVRCLACRGIVTGYPDGTFRPANPVTRGQLSKIVANAAGLSGPPGSQLFQDVLPGSTFYDFVQRLATLGYISGYPCGNPEPCVPPLNLPYFRPNNDVTRGQITKIVANAASLSDPPGAQLFEDVLPGSTFYDFVQRLANQGVMSGYPCGSPEPCVPPDNRPYFRPNSGATRGQVSKIVANTFFPNCDPQGR